MAEWPVEIIDFEELGVRKREPIPPGRTLRIARGEARPVKGYHFQCPCCGVVYWVPIKGENIEGPEWDATGPEERLTLRPSLLCNNPKGSGGHYFLTDGVLREA